MGFSALRTGAKGRRAGSSSHDSPRPTSSTALAAHLPPGLRPLRAGVRRGSVCAERALTVRFKTGHTDEADVVIGADGIRSAVRTADPRPRRATVLQATHAGAASARDRRASKRDTSANGGNRGKQVGITTLTDDRVYWWATKNAAPGGHEADERAFPRTSSATGPRPAPTIFATTPADRIFRNEASSTVRRTGRGRGGAPA